MALAPGPKLWAAGAVGGAAVLLSLATAFACNPLTKLTVTTTEVVAGEQATGKGTDFYPSGGSNPAPDPAVLLLGGPGGVPVWSGQTDTTAAFVFRSPFR